VTTELPSAELRERVLAAAQSHPAPTRAAGRKRNTVVIALGFALPVAISAWAGGPGTRLPIGYTVLLGASWLLVSLVATWEAVGRGGSMLGRPAVVRAVVAGVTPVALLVTASVAALLWPATLAIPAGLEEHVVCVVFTILFALGPLVAFVVVRRQSDPVAPTLTGAALGAASGAWGALAIELHCAHASAFHIVVGHVLPVVFLTAVGALVGSRVIGMRARTDLL